MKAKESKKKVGRPSKREMTQISISIPKAFLPHLNTLAASQSRNRSNFIANIISKLVDKFLADEKKE